MLDKPQNTPESTETTQDSDKFLKTGLNPLKYTEEEE